MNNYFADSELKCPCCNTYFFSEGFKKNLNEIRESYGKAIIVNSAYRCSKHNRDIGGISTSSHVLGLAVDLKCTNSVDRLNLISAIIECGITRIGVRRDFIHIDIDVDKPFPVLWLY